MKIEVTHVIKADSQIVSLVNAFLSALGTQSENLSVADAVELTPKTSVEKEETTKASKRTYLFHEESGAAIVVNKGEELTEHLEKGLVEISKTEYDRIQAEKQTRIDKAKEQTNVAASQSGDGQSSETEDHGITMEMIRAEATKLTSNGRQADFKAILTSFNAPKLSAVPEEKYPDLLAAIKEAVGEV
ncbi:hypothetical protein ACQKII_14235 [Lysinibacillus sp. NPDC048646]|uniref:hypothetical protein n=1 Tax=Lysinibacillus sp. NPDC048646 TaxID=3390574 RepID=UPI003D07EF21